jgi:hypothetical protein
MVKTVMLLKPKLVVCNKATNEFANFKKENNNNRLCVLLDSRLLQLIHRQI